MFGKKPDAFDIMCEVLRQNPDRMAVLPDGTALLALVDLETNQFIAIKAPPGVNFAKMTETELNQHLIDTLS